MRIRENENDFQRGYMQNSMLYLRGYIKVGIKNSNAA